MSNPLALDPCPDCREVDQCFTRACVCPVCSDDPRAIEAWTALAPVMRLLNEADVIWDWGTDSIILDGPTRHFLVINGRDVWYEIRLTTDLRFVVEKLFISAFDDARVWDSKNAYTGSSAALAAAAIDFKSESC